jgi:uncharacterized membrane protein
VYETTAPRVFVAVCCATFFCAALTTLDYLVGLYNVNGPDHFREYAFSKGTSIFAFAWGAWVVGFLIFAAWPWTALHRRGHRTLLVAVFAGALATFFGQFMLSTGFLTACVRNMSSSVGGVQMWESGSLTTAGWIRAFNQSLITLVIGAFAAAILWRIAYRKV